MGEEFKFPRLGGVGRGRSVQHVVFVIALGDLPARVLSFLLNRFPAGQGTGAPVDDIARHHHLVGGQPCHGGEYGVQGHAVGMDVGQDDQTHGRNLV